MSGFNNPVVGGTKLVRDAIQSPDYAAATTGWSINQDGTAEFNQVTVRGPVQVIGSDGSYVYVQTSGGTAEIVLEPPTQPGYTWSPGTIATESDGLSGSADLVITSPQQQGSAGTAQIILEGADGSRSTTLISLSADHTQVPGDLSVIGVMSGSNIAGSVSVSFTSLTTFTQVVTFPEAFATVPAVITNINSGNGAAAHWDSRAINITNTGFTLFVYAPPSGTAQTWSNIPVQWIAIGT